MSKAKLLEKITDTHTDLNMFASIVTLLEGGHIYSSTPRVQRSVERIIAICQKEQSELLSEHDRAVLSLNLKEHPHG